MTKPEKINGFKIYKKPYINASIPLLSFIIRIVLVIVMSVSCVSIGFNTLNITFDFSLVIYVSIAVAVVGSFMYINTGLAITMLIGSLIWSFYYVYNNLTAIKLGVLSIFSQGYDIVRNSLGLPYADGFAIVENGDFTNEINIILMLITFVIAVLLSFFVGRYLSVIFSAIVTFICICYCFFLENVNDKLSVILLMSSFVTVVFLKMSGYFKPVISSGFKKIRNKHYVKSDGLFMLQSVGATLSVGFVIILCVSTIFDNAKFNLSVEPMAINNYIKYTIKDVMVLKYAEYKKFVIPSNIDPGQLGFYSCVEPEFKDLFVIKTEPIESDKLFLKSYTGSDYTYRSNSWTNKNVAADINMTDAEANALKASGADYKTIDFTIYSNKGFSDKIYIPYYTPIADTTAYNYVNDCTVEGTVDKKYSVNMYNKDDFVFENNQYRDYIYENYTYVSDENKKVIEDILNQLNLTKDSENIEQCLRTYFEENYSYDFDTGILPFGKDFVNYFLTENKKGNFAHFATSAVLMYRTLGIPARYAGGYAVDKEQFFTKRPNRNGTVSVHVNSGNAYSWVEVYEDGFGWKPVDISPSPGFMELSEKYDSEEENENTLNNKYTNVLEDYFKPIENEYYNPIKFGKNIIKTLISILLFIILFIILFLAGKFIFRKLKWINKYNKGNNSVKAYMLMEKLRIKLKLSDESDYTEFGKTAFEKGLSKKDSNILSETANRLVYSKDVNNKDLDVLKNIISKIK